VFSLLAVITVVDEMMVRQELPYDVFELHPLGEVQRELSQRRRELWEGSQAEPTQVVVPGRRMNGSFDV
jgi:hypothetical protein